jgi:myo-inositol-1(or 4)-monophosphatase
MTPSDDATKHTSPSDDLARPLGLRALAETAARRAGDYLRERFGDAGRIDHKSAIDLVTDADRQAESVIIETLHDSAPDHAILTEEGGKLGPEHAAVRWIIDPLDGTTNFAHSFAMFAVSVAAELRGHVVAGAVYVPMLDEMFTAERGAGAHLKTSHTGMTGSSAFGEPIRVSGVERLDSAFLATGFPYDIRTNPDNNLEHFARFSTCCLAIRRAGAAALDLAYLACGRFDGFWELRLKPWDWAAASLLVEEAGGRITAADGGPFRLDAPGCCASNGLIHSEMLEVLARGEFIRSGSAG